MERTTTGVAGVGLTLPAWEQSLDHISAVAGMMVPILSALWLLVQLVVYLRKLRRGM